MGYFKIAHEQTYIDSLSLLSSRADAVGTLDLMVTFIMETPDRRSSIPCNGASGITAERSRLNNIDRAFFEFQRNLTALQPQRRLAEDIPAPAMEGGDIRLIIKRNGLDIGA